VKSRQIVNNVERELTVVFTTIGGASSCDLYTQTHILFIFLKFKRKKNMQSQHFNAKKIDTKKIKCVPTKVNSAQLVFSMEAISKKKV